MAIEKHTFLTVALAVAIGCAMRDEASGPDIPAAHPATYGTTAPAQTTPWRIFESMHADLLVNACRASSQCMQSF